MDNFETGFDEELEIPAGYDALQAPLFPDLTTEPGALLPDDLANVLDPEKELEDPTELLGSKDWSVASPQTDDELSLDDLENQTNLKNLEQESDWENYKSQALQKEENQLSVVRYRFPTQQNTAEKPGEPETTSKATTRRGKKRAASNDQPESSKPARRKRQPEKGTEEYIRNRGRNNIAVKKSRDKAREKQEQLQQEHKELSERNQRLEKEVEGYKKELAAFKAWMVGNLGLEQAQAAFVLVQQRMSNDSE